MLAAHTVEVATHVDDVLDLATNQETSRSGPVEQIFMSVLLETNLPLRLLHRGKVRDNYELGDRLLIVASDRISAFDVVLPCGIPDKGAVLNLISAFWFEKTAHVVPNHLLEVVKDTAQLKAYGPKEYGYPAALAHRSMIVRKAKRISI